MSPHFESIVGLVGFVAGHICDRLWGERGPLYYQATKIGMTGLMELLWFILLIGSSRSRVTRPLELHADAKKWGNVYKRTVPVLVAFM